VAAAAAAAAAGRRQEGWQRIGHIRGQVSWQGAAGCPLEVSLSYLILSYLILSYLEVSLTEAGCVQWGAGADSQSLA